MNDQSTNQSSSYERAAIQVAIAQMVEAAGFDSAQQSSLDILNDLLINHMTQVGSVAHSYAEVAGRTTPNAVDVVCRISPNTVIPEYIPNTISCRAYLYFNLAYNTQTQLYRLFCSRHRHYTT